MTIPHYKGSVSDTELVSAELIQVAMDAAVGGHVPEGQELPGDEIDFEAALKAAAPLIYEQALEPLLARCDDQARRSKAVWREVEGLTEFERTHAKATTEAYEAMARFIRGEDISGQIRRERAALDTTSHEGVDRG